MTENARFTVVQPDCSSPMKQFPLHDAYDFGNGQIKSLTENPLPVNSLAASIQVTSQDFLSFLATGECLDFNGVLVQSTACSFVGFGH